MCPIVIDMSLGRESYFSIMTAFQNDRMSLKAICVTDPRMDRTAHGALHLLAHLAAQIPVCKGIRVPIGKEPQPEPYGGMWPQDQVSQVPAVEMLHKLVHEYPGELTILCHGLLTTEAVFLQKYPQDAELIGNIVIVDYLTENTQDPGVEVTMDLTAAKIILASNAKVTWIPPEVISLHEKNKGIVREITERQDTMIGRFLRHSTICKTADAPMITSLSGILATLGQVATRHADDCIGYPAVNTEIVTDLRTESVMAPGFGIVDTPELLAYYKLHEGEHHHEE